MPGRPAPRPHGGLPPAPGGDRAEIFREAFRVYVRVQSAKRLAVLCHPLVLVELACGAPPSPRHRTLEDLGNLDQATSAGTQEILGLVERRHLHETGCGAVDVSLLASALITLGARLWTDDRALRAQAERLGVAYAPPSH